VYKLLLALVHHSSSLWPVCPSCKPFCQFIYCSSCL